jgi:hypothetical protein
VVTDDEQRSAPVLERLGLGGYVLGRQRRHHQMRLLIKADRAGVVRRGARAGLL